MKTLITTILIAMTVLFFPAIAGDDVPAVITDKCVKCHLVSSHSIETTKKDPSKAHDLANVGSLFTSPDEMKTFLLKESERNGEKHKTKFKGDDAELEQLVTWLMGLKQG